jgi:hypothetical protein
LVFLRASDGGIEIERKAIRTLVQQIEVGPSTPQLRGNSSRRPKPAGKLSADISTAFPRNVVFVTSFSLTYLKDGTPSMLWAP